MRWLVACFVVLGCRAERINTAAPPPNNLQSTTSLDRELARRQELDYRSPMRERWSADEEMEYRDRLKFLCESGDPTACRRAHHRRVGSARADISRYCRGGDEISCRWDRWWQALNASTKTATQFPYPFTLPVGELRRGCAAGLHAECDVLIRTAVPENVRLGAENNCRFDERDCVRAAESYLHDEPRMPARGRDLVELDCQRDALDACLWLSVAYRSKAFAEPVPGRSDALHLHLCTNRYSPFCADADTKCNQWRETFLLAPNACPAKHRAPLGR